MSTDKNDQQLAAPDWGRFGFINQGAVLAFYNSDVGKLVQNEEASKFIEEERQKIELQEYYTKIEERRQAILVAMALYEAEVNEEDVKKRVEENEKALAKITPKVEQPTKEPESKSDLKGKLDSVNKEILHSAKKYKEFESAADTANTNVQQIADTGKINDKDELAALEILIKEKEAEQGVLDKKINGWDGKDENELRASVDEYNNNEVTLGVYRTLRDVKTGNAVMYDANGERTTKFSEAAFTVPVQKNEAEQRVLLKVKDQFYLIKQSDLKGLDDNASPEAKLKHLESQKNEKGVTKAQEAQSAFEKDKPKMSNVKDLVMHNKKLEMAFLAERQVDLKNKLTQVNNLSQGYSVTTTPSPQQLGSPANTQVGTYNPSNLPVGTQTASPSITPTGNRPSVTKPSEQSEARHSTVKKH